MCVMRMCARIMCIVVLAQTACAEDKNKNDKLRALLNKIPEKATAPSQISMIGVMMKAAVRECWRVPKGMKVGSRLVVDVEVKLNETGAIVGEPRVLNPQSDPVFHDAALNAVRAIKQCAPYADLPKKLHKGGWDHMVLRFDPLRMF